jgi:hypothetical protein
MADVQVSARFITPADKRIGFASLTLLGRSRRLGDWRAYGASESASDDLTKSFA